MAPHAPHPRVAFLALLFSASSLARSLVKMSTPHPEEEPLLPTDHDSTMDESPQSFSSRTRSALRSPKSLNGLEKALAALSILLLLLTAVFSGLFAGEAVKLKRERHRPPPSPPHRNHPTSTVTATATVPGPTQTSPVPPKQPGTPGKNVSCFLSRSEGASGGREGRRGCLR